jgi:hypothetical protein
MYLSMHNVFCVMSMYAICLLCVLQLFVCTELINIHKDSSGMMAVISSVLVRMPCKESTDVIRGKHCVFIGSYMHCHKMSDFSVLTNDF